MTTPHQGPGMWQQGNRDQALDWLANLDPRQQQALQRSIQTHQALGPIYNATNRVIQTAQRTAARLSDYAQRLASSAQVNRAVEFGQNVAAQATELGQRGRDNVTEAVGRTTAAVTNAGNRAIDGATAAGRGIADGATAAGRGLATAGRQVAATGRQAVEAGQNAVGKVSRWFKEKQSNTSVRANAARAAFQAFRTDPALQQTVSPKDVKVLSEQAAAIGTAKNWEELNAAIQQFGQSADQRLGVPSQNAQGANAQGTDGQSANAQSTATQGTATQGTSGQGTSGQGTSGQASAAEKASNPAWALQGTTDPRGALTQNVGGQAPGGQAAGGQGQQGEAAKTTGGKHRSGPETER
ncbi:hypothetical protein F1D05_12415 [Kribbella qitaiheensis]|uniref:Uncharacterized protein n=1 Tax=Kribbella qitaiheensis TaxID=1544730 RepID=A0A7G6WX46_9ACTN|nr:hypothetical protein [Kribbella qitaiheensis]QNE18561.1 hypothetical protein F1D05_12415 [Kribbella qitaiheensis]